MKTAVNAWKQYLPNEVHMFRCNSSKASTINFHMEPVTKGKVVELLEEILSTARPRRLMLDVSQLHCCHLSMLGLGHLEI